MLSKQKPPRSERRLLEPEAKSQAHVAEIDGLRAFAVLAVLLFHGFPALVPGGYIGVDVFFVISGFVIARTYLDRLTDRRVSLADFYLRRVRRLAPAYTLVLAVSTALAFWLLEPRMLRNFAQSLLAQPIYAQNFVFWVEGDYFDSALTKPLLHTWSLAIEEQFYLLFGLVILVVRAWPQALVPLLGIGSAISIALGVWISDVSPKTAFFLVPTRAWEFAFGIGAFLVARRIRTRPGGTAGAVAYAACLAALVIAVLAFDESSAFPGWHSALACGAVFTLLILFDRFPSAAYRVLTTPIARRLGELSYSLYLWHWPLIVFAVIALKRDLMWHEAGAILLLSGVLAELTYRFVEDPVRRRELLGTTPRLVTAWGMGSAVLLLAGALFLTSKGGVFRYPEAVRPLWLASLERSPYRCPKIFRLQNPNAEICPLNEVAGEGGILIIGDSHADQIDQMIGQLGARASVPVYMTVRNCDLDELGRTSYCAPAVATEILSQARAVGVEHVIATSLWADSGLEYAAFEAPVGDLLRGGIQTVFISEVVPYAEYFDPALRARRILSGAQFAAGDGYPLAQYITDVAAQRTIFEELEARHPGQVHILRPSQVLCGASQCDFATDGYPNYLDGSHVTRAGARRLEPVYAEVVSSVASMRNPPFSGDTVELTREGRTPASK